MQFIANRGHKAVDEALCLAREFSEVESKLERSKKTRMEILHEAKERECVATCEGKRLEAANCETKKSCHPYFVKPYMTH